MPRFAANLSMMYAELPFLERFGAAAADGFGAVEYLFPYAWQPEVLDELLRRHSLQQVLINAPAGGRDPVSAQRAWDGGDRGTACLPGRQEEFRSGVALALQYARALRCPRIHAMAGVIPAGAKPEELLACYIDNLRWAARFAASAGVEVLIEPINIRDMPGYYLNRQDQAHAVLAAAGQANLKVQMDLYHCQIVEGDVATKMRAYIPGGSVTHVQIAGVPDRNEPDIGELNFPYLMGLLDALEYRGWVGCEYRPKLGNAVHATRAGLGWMGMVSRRPPLGDTVPPL
jgi:hydroxypyruvate isomerase